jgi:hypothetical protein
LFFGLKSVAAFCDRHKKCPVFVVKKELQNVLIFRGKCFVSGFVGKVYFFGFGRARGRGKFCSGKGKHDFCTVGFQSNILCRGWPKGTLYWVVNQRIVL